MSEPATETSAEEIAAGSASQRCAEPACGARYHINERLYVCPRCGGLLDVEVGRAGLKSADELRDAWRVRRTSGDARARSGVWRFRELLPFAEDAPAVTLAEGNTPLYDAPRSALYCRLDALRLKHQGCNPTGSFKDTGMTTAVTQAVVVGARTVVCASTGNTAASLAAYAARAHLLCAILVPRGQVSHAKLAQSLDYGARVLELEGNFDDAMRAVRELAEDDSVYLVNSINPFRIEGQKTVAFELAEQLSWRVPDHVVVPGGNLGNSSALGKGFKELLDLGLIERLPRLSVVQAEGAAPFARMFTRGAGGERATHDDGRAATEAGRAATEVERAATVEDLSPGVEGAGEGLSADEVLEDSFRTVERPRTLATAIRIGAPVSWKKALRAVRWTGGRVLSVSEQEIADAKAVIGRDGVGCEPASATTVAGIRRLVACGFIKQDEAVVAVLTGHVLKDAEYVINYHRGTLRAHDPAPGETQDGQSIRGTFANSPARVRATKEAILEQLERACEGGASAGDLD
jgi:threonine synthase